MGEHRNKKIPLFIAVLLGVFGISLFITAPVRALANPIATTQAESLMYTRDGITNTQATQASLLWNSFGVGTVDLPTDATSITVTAYGKSCAGAPEMTLHIDGKKVIDQLVEQTSPTSITANITLIQGKHNLVLGYMNDYATDLKTCDRNLYVDKIDFQQAVTSPVVIPQPQITPPTTLTSTKLRYNPPKLVSPTTITLGTQSETVKMDSKKDYILKMPRTAKGTTTLDGGHNVVMIGGYLRSGADKDVALYVKNSTGTLHLEGLLIDNKNGGDGDGISGSSKGTIQIQNSRIINIMGQENTRHGDAVQIWGDTSASSKLTLKIDKLTATTANQGLFLRPNTEWVIDPATKKIVKVNRRYTNTIALSNIDLYYNNKEQDSRSKGQAGDLLWLSDSTLPTDLEACRSADNISMTNVYFGRFMTNTTEKNSVWPDVHNTKCPSTITGKNISWVNSGLVASNGKDKAVISGFATVGKPPQGEFVPDGVAGANYVSPGYQNGTTATIPPVVTPPTPPATTVPTTTQSTTDLQAEKLTYTGAPRLVDTTKTTTTLFWNSKGTGTVTLSQDATQLSVSAGGTSCNGSPRMVVTVDGTKVLDQAVTSTQLTAYTAKTAFTKGAHKVEIALVNDLFKSASCDRNLTLDKATFSSTPPVAVTPDKTNILWQSNYDTMTPGTNVSPAWYRAQKPRSPGDAPSPIREDSITIAKASTVPGTGTYKPKGNALRVELRPYNGGKGDVTNTGGYLASRAEVYDRQPTSASTAPVASWPDPVGSTRWYSWSVFVPSDFATNNTDWLTITQFKGVKGGSPPLGVGIWKGNFVSDSVIDSIDSQGVKTRKNINENLGTLNKGAWTRFEVGVHWSENTNDGWVNIYKNSTEVVPKKSRPTISMVNGKVDPIYLKQGIYRAKAWTATHVLYFGPTKIGMTRADVK